MMKKSEKTPKNLKKAHLGAKPGPRAPQIFAEKSTRGKSQKVLRWPGKMKGRMTSSRKS
jgi:hypothetical protein